MCCNSSRLKLDLVSGFPSSQSCISLLSSEAKLPVRAGCPWSPCLHSFLTQLRTGRGNQWPQRSLHPLSMSPPWGLRSRQIRLTWGGAVAASFSLFPVSLPLLCAFSLFLLFPPLLPLRHLNALGSVLGLPWLNSRSCRIVGFLPTWGPVSVLWTSDLQCLSSASSLNSKPQCPLPSLVPAWLSAEPHT